MALNVFIIQKFIQAIKSGNTAALRKVLAANREIAENAELMLEGLEKAIEVDLGKGTHISVLEELLKFPAVTANLLNEQNKILRKAIVLSPCMARRLIAINAVADALRNNADLATLRHSLVVAGLINQKNIVCEVSDLVPAKSSLCNGSALLFNIVGPNRKIAKQKYQALEKIVQRVPADVAALIFSYLPKTNQEQEAITLRELSKLFPSKPYDLRC